MKRHLFLILASLGCFTACAHHVQRAPSLTATPEQQQPAEHKKSFLSRTADATWNAVSAPVRLITPQKKPATPPPEPETFQAPEAIIIIPQAEGGEGLLGVATQPAATPAK
ncbi:MAG: hypothetical protein ACTHN5_10860 [Phycisphaerae bacterium]